MSQAPVSASGLVRVTVSSGTRRVDLVLPGSVPVAELVPELARSVGLLDAATVYGGYRVVTADGRELAGESGLTSQGIEDGGLLTVTAGVDEAPPRVYDDVVEAMTDVVERDLQPWAPAVGRRTALVAAGLLMALGAVGAADPVRVAARRRGRGRGRGRAGGRADRAVAGPARAPRRRSPWPGWAAVYAAVSGLMLVLRQDPTSSASRSRAPAVRALVAGLSSAWSASARGARWRSRRWSSARSSWPPGCSPRPARFDPAVVLTTALAIVVLAGSVFPWLALGVHRHQGRPAVLPRRHHRRPGRDRPRAGRRRRPGRPPDPGRGLRDRRAAAGPGRAARGQPSASPAPCSRCSPAWS